MEMLHDATRVEEWFRVRSVTYQRDELLVGRLVEHKLSGRATSRFVSKMRWVTHGYADYLGSTSCRLDLCVYFSANAMFHQPNLMA